MRRRILMSAIAAGTALFLVSTGWADVPPPPVNQSIGMADVGFPSHSEADCRVCHDSGVEDRHHVLYDERIIPGSVVPYPDSDGDGTPDIYYDCLNCHDQNFTVVRDCLACHTSSAHHSTQIAQSGDCTSCHGDLVDNMSDGHYIPSYDVSLVTPLRSVGAGRPDNSYGKGAGACDYCHDQDTLQPPLILSNQDLHHDFADCSWCHDFGLPFDWQIRICEGCHGPDSLHNIQADSPQSPTGTIVIGGEFAGYGHVGRDAGPGDSDCWGCHGFGMSKAAFAPGPIIPTIRRVDRAAVADGADTVVSLSGSAFTNIAGETKYTSEVTLTAADGSVSVLAPDRLDESSLEFTIPGETAPGNYDVRAVKDGERSNLAVISIRPQVIIVEATGRKTVTIHGSGFGGYAEGSGTAVTGTRTSVPGWHRRTPIMEATIVSWSDTTIVAEFRSPPNQVTVNSVFGTAQTKVFGSRNGRDRGRRP